jgi:hypothetical protein
MDDFIANCKDRATGAMEWFLRAFSHVPEDKLSWSPSPTARNALQIAAHCAGFSGGFASVIGTGEFPADVDDFLGPIHARIASINTREEAESMLREGIAETVAALDTVQPEQIDAMVITPQGSTPFAFYMTIPAIHLLIHTGQLDYLQTCWGDQEVHLSRLT